MERATSRAVRHPDPTAIQYRPDTGRNRVHRTRRVTGRGRTHRLRLVYFGMASLWGFLVGILVLVGLMARSGTRIGISLGAASAWLAPGAALAVFGGGLAARAYRSSRSRER